MPSRIDIINEARSWMGTPWIHQGRLKGTASDCVGFIIGVGVAAGALPPDFNVSGYPRAPAPEILRRNLDRWLDKATMRDLMPADIVLLAPRRIATHVGIYTDKQTIIHAIDKARGVTEHRLDDRWRAAIRGVYRYRGVT